MATHLITADMTMYRALRKVAETYPERPALTYGDKTISYPELMGHVDALARALRALGVKAGDKVGVILPNCMELVYAFFAPAAIGAVFVPINCVYRQKEIRHILEDSEAVVVIADPKPQGNDVEGILRAVKPSLPCLRHVILRGPVAAPNGFVSSDALPDDGLPLEADAVSADALCALIYTSGTTGVPKAVMQSHRSMMGAVFQAQKLAILPFHQKLWRLMKLSRRYGLHFLRRGFNQPVGLSPAPLHALLGYSSLIYGLLYGARVVIADRFHPPKVLELIEHEQVTHIVVAPTMLNALLNSPEFARRDLSSLLSVSVSSALCPPELAQRAQVAFHCPISISFGATELGGGSLATRPFDAVSAQIETVGRPSPEVGAKVVDDQRRPLPARQVGELALRMQTTMLGYYKAPELTAQALDNDGWYYTGDLATMDEQGYIRIVGRKKDMIIRGGQNVFPAEIENHLLSKPGVQQVAAVGVPDPIAGERVWAYVVPQPGATLTPADVWGYCRAELAAYKVPDQVRIVDSLPLTSTGKVQKFLLRETAMKEKNNG